MSTYSDVQLVFWCPKRTFILPPKYRVSVLHMLSQNLCYLKTNINFRAQAWNRPPHSVGSRDLFYSITIMPNIFSEDPGNLKHPKNVKSINNTMGSHLVSCRVIPRPATMKGSEKEVFSKIRTLGNLKCNKSNNLKSS